MPFRSELDEDRLGVADLVRLEAGQAVGKDFRQHGDDAVGQVNACAAVAGLAVQGGARTNEVRHVGNVDPQPPMAAGSCFQRNRVVEVAGVNRIDRDDRLRRSGRADPGAIDSSNLLGIAAGFVQGVFGEMRRASRTRE